MTPYHPRIHPDDERAEQLHTLRAHLVSPHGLLSPGEKPQDHGWDDEGAMHDYDHRHNRTADLVPFNGHTHDRIDTCVHCGRTITRTDDGGWIDPEPTGDDETWGEVCDRHEAFNAIHEPEGGAR